MVVSYFNSGSHWYLIVVTVEKWMSLGRLYLLSSMSLKDYGCNSILVLVYCRLRVGINGSITVEKAPNNVSTLLSLSRASCLYFSEVVSVVNRLSSSTLLDLSTA